MKNVISYSAPKFRPLPTAITEADVRDATLPVKIEAARRAIQQCEDLSELLRYQDQAQGLAAAVRIMKHVAPELVRSANEMVVDAWRKGGDLLARYSGSAINSSVKGKPISSQRGFTHKSPRGKICESLELSQVTARNMVRIAAAPKDIIYDIAQKTTNIQRVAKSVPRIIDTYQKPAATAGYMSIMGGHERNGLTMIASILKRIPHEAVKQLTPDERKSVKVKITEIMESLDEMERLCR